jgi:hypothetical protein
MSFNPKLYAYFSDSLNSAVDNDPSLERNFEPGVSCFAACTFNLGLQTTTLRHRDNKNLLEGMCGVACLGNHDPTKGGHLVLWDLGLVIEFPAGSTILLLSATLEHSNVPIQPGETRCSFVQYSAAGLFRWVENGFCSDESIFTGIQGSIDDWFKVRATRIKTALDRIAYHHFNTALALVA